MNPGVLEITGNVGSIRLSQEQKKNLFWLKINMQYKPDRWVILKIEGKDPHYKIFGSWFGGYGGADSWRMNSGIVSVSEDEYCYTFAGYSGSEYVCYKESYGAHSYGWATIDSFKKMHKYNISELNEIPDIMNIDWIIK